MNKNISIISNSNENKKSAKIIVLATCMVLVTAAMSYANTLYVGPTFSTGIASIVKKDSKSESGGSMDVSILDTHTLDYLYCVDLFTDVLVGTTYSSTTVTNTGFIGDKKINNAGEVAWLLDNYGTGGQNNQAMALQAAIWTVIYDNPNVYQLDQNASSNKVTDSTHKTIDEWYTQMMTNISTKSGTISDVLWITPGDGTNNSFQGLITSAAAPTPEPATMVLFGLGLAGLTGLRLRKKNNKLS